jgi:uncharacterized protein YndB with AHSA1/START domain
MTTQTLTLEQRIKATPAKVWDRITTPEGIARWWRPGNIAPILGHEFTMDMGQWGEQPCRIIEMIPERKLAYTFSTWELHWTITPVDDGCLLTLEHRGFDMDDPQQRMAFEKMGAGWRSMILPRLAEVSEEAA